VFNPDGVGLEYESVGGNGHFHDFPEDGPDVFQPGWPEGEEIDILRRSGRFLVPKGKQHCAFEEELVGVP
jgi:hypothetical protein